MLGRKGFNLSVGTRAATDESALRVTKQNTFLNLTFMIFTEKQSQTSSIKASWITLTASTASDGISATKRNGQWPVKRLIPLRLNFHGIYSLER